MASESEIRVSSFEFRGLENQQDIAASESEFRVSSSECLGLETRNSKHKTQVYIAGDVHLGSPHGGVGFARWLDWLASRPPVRLVILGDLFEYWLESSAAVARHAVVLERLRQLRDRGWHIELVRGNREMVAGRRLEIAGGLRLHRRLDLLVGGRRLRVVHGDRLCHDPGYRALAALMASFWQRAWQALHPPAMQDVVARWMRRRSRGNRPMTGRRIFIDPRRVVASSRGCDHLIAGHVHQAWTRVVRGCPLTLVGDWPGSSGHWLEVQTDGRIRHRLHDFSAGAPAASWAPDLRPGAKGELPT